MNQNKPALYSTFFLYSQAGYLEDEVREILISNFLKKFDYTVQSVSLVQSFHKFWIV
jgi:hypothetical protein